MQEKLKFLRKKVKAQHLLFYYLTLNHDGITLSRLIDVFRGNYDRCREDNVRCTITNCLKSYENNIDNCFIALTFFYCKDAAKQSCQLEDYLTKRYYRLCKT